MTDDYRIAAPRHRDFTAQEARSLARMNASATIPADIDRVINRIADAVDTGRRDITMRSLSTGLARNAAVAAHIEKLGYTVEHVVSSVGAFWRISW